MNALLVILTWLKNNWFIPVGFALIVAIFFVGYHLGGKLQLATDQKRIDQIVGDAQTAQNKLQASADKKAKEYEAARTLSQGKLAAAQKELTHARIVYSPYNTCHVDADFMQLYAGVAAPGAKGDVPAKPH